MQYSVTVTHAGVPIETVSIDAITPSHAKMRVHTWRKAADFHEPGDLYEACQADEATDEVALAVLQAQANEHFCPGTWQGLGLMIVDEHREAV